MSPEPEEAASATLPFLRLKALTVFLLPASPVIVWTLVNPQFPDGQLPPGTGLALLLLVSLVPLTWSLLFMITCTVLNGYARVRSGLPIPRTERWLTALEWVTCVLFVAIAVTTELRRPYWLLAAYGLFLVTTAGHYLYVLYHVLVPGCEFRYTSLFFRVGFVVLYVLTGLGAVGSVYELLSSEFMLLLWFNVLVVVVFAVLTGIGSLVGYSYYRAARPAAA